MAETGFQRRQYAVCLPSPNTRPFAGYGGHPKLFYQCAFYSRHQIGSYRPFSSIIQSVKRIPTMQAVQRSFLASCRFPRSLIRVLSVHFSTERS